MDLPSILYLYLSAPSPDSETDDLLARTRFKLSKPSNLNDPFDMIPAMTPSSPASHIRQFLELKAAKHGYGPITPKMVADFKAQTDRESQKTDFSRDDLLTRTRMLCLTERKDGVMMWSHYSSRHAGFVVGFRTEVLRSLHPECSLFEVTYEEQRPICTPLDFIATEEKYGLLEKVFSVKSKEWHYEKEWRCLFGLAQLGGSDYLDFPARAVECIILGSSISEDTENKVKRATLAGKVHETAKLCRGRLSPQSFSIHIEPTTWRM